MLEKYGRKNIIDEDRLKHSLVVASDTYKNAEALIMKLRSDN